MTIRKSVAIKYTFVKPKTSLILTISPSDAIYVKTKFLQHDHITLKKSLI